jgi:hypothetical protein
MRTSGEKKGLTNPDQTNSPQPIVKITNPAATPAGGTISDQ